MEDEEKIKALEPLDETEYENVDNDRLVLYTVNVLEEEEIEPTYDKIVVASFKLFPGRFSLIGFPGYPDGKRAHDCLFHLTYKTKKWLFGNPKSGYSITDKGKYYLEETKKMLRGEIEREGGKIESTPKRKELTFINLLRKSEAYNKYVDRRGDTITEKNFFEALKLHGKKSEEVNINWKKYLQYARRIDDKEVEEFLLRLREDFNYLFGG